MTTAKDEDDERLMRLAIEEARKALASGEVPIGAVLARDGEPIAMGFNQPIQAKDPTAHAEIVALREAAQHFGNYRLANSVMYSTIEPCAMCAGALIQARVSTLVYGARDEKAGAVDSHFHICDASQLNHRVEVISGVLEVECRALMQEFFKVKRQK
jgi:tRNA(Arg) A34 adenosine deaminase TadA